MLGVREFKDVLRFDNNAMRSGGNFFAALNVELIEFHDYLIDEITGCFCAFSLGQIKST